MNYLTLEIVSEETIHANIGDLLITLTEEGKDYLSNQQESNATDEQIFLEMLEANLCNGYHIVPPENIGALTDSLIIADDIIDNETPADAKINVWWYPMYAVKTYLDDLNVRGSMVFTNAENK